MREDWDKAIAFVLKMEGGDTVENVADDHGGETKFGISKASYPGLDIANLTLESAKEIYHRDYWSACSCDDLPTAFAIAVFDAAVNQGVTPAKRMLQLALDVTVDGVIGPLTLDAATKASPYRVKKYLSQRLVRYTNIIIKDATQLKFSFDWYYRIISLSELILTAPTSFNG